MPPALMRSAMCSVVGLYGNTDTLARAAKHVIVSVEEIITSAEIRRMPNLTTIPYYYVDAIVHAPVRSPLAGIQLLLWS